MGIFPRRLDSNLGGGIMSVVEHVVNETVRLIAEHSLTDVQMKDVHKKLNYVIELELLNDK
jgi:hypothetical protein